MFVLAQFAFAGLLIAVACVLVLFWLFLLAMSYGGQSSLMPWVGAGVILYGLAFVAIAAIAGVPGILWANHLARSVPLKWQKIAKTPGWIGVLTLALGFVVSITVLVGEQFRAKDLYDGCVIYRDAAAPAALGASGAARGADCPTQK